MCFGHVKDQTYYRATCGDCKNQARSSTVSQCSPSAFGFVRFLLQTAGEVFKRKKIHTMQLASRFSVNADQEMIQLAVFTSPRLIIDSPGAFKHWMIVHWQVPKREMGAFWSILQCQHKQILYSPVWSCRAAATWLSNQGKWE